MNTIKQIAVVTFLMLYCLMMPQCDSDKKLQEQCDEAGCHEKAEALIKEELFRYIPDSKSYELVSLDLDSITETWVAVPGILDVAKQYKEATRNQEYAEAYLNELKEIYKKEQEIMVNQFLFTDASIWDIAIANQNGVTKENIKNAEDQLSDCNRQVSEIRRLLSEKLKSAKDDFVGWHATHTYRAKDGAGNTQLYTRHYYITSDFTKIILEWEDGNDSVTSMLSLISSSQKEIADISVKTAEGIVGEAVLANGKKLSFKLDHSIPEMPGSTWQKVDEAIVIHSNGGVPYWSLIDGYLYIGEYKDGECWNEKWNDEFEYMEDISYSPEPSKGDKLKSFHWY